MCSVPDADVVGGPGPRPLWTPTISRDLCAGTPSASHDSTISSAVSVAADIRSKPAHDLRRHLRHLLV